MRCDNRSNHIVPYLDNRYHSFLLATPYPPTCCHSAPYRVCVSSILKRSVRLTSSFVPLFLLCPRGHYRSSRMVTDQNISYRPNIQHFPYLYHTTCIAYPIFLHTETFRYISDHSHPQPFRLASKPTNSSVSITFSNTEYDPHLPHLNLQYICNLHASRRRITVHPESTCLDVLQKNIVLTISPRHPHHLATNIFPHPSQYSQYCPRQQYSCHHFATSLPTYPST